jgi:hypothetical protein
MENNQSTNEQEATEESPPPGLGDLAEAFFKSVGITADRYRAVKVKFHLDPNCKCADRRRWLNEVGAKLGVDGVVVKLARWMDQHGKERHGKE